MLRGAETRSCAARRGRLRLHEETAPHRLAGSLDHSNSPRSDECQSVSAAAGKGAAGSPHAAEHEVNGESGCLAALARKGPGSIGDAAWGETRAGETARGASASPAGCPQDARSTCSGSSARPAERLADPTAGSPARAGTCNIKLRMLDGSIVQRTFSASTSVAEVRGPLRHALLPSSIPSGLRPSAATAPQVVRSALPSIEERREYTLMTPIPRKVLPPPAFPSKPISTLLARITLRTPPGARNTRVPIAEAYAPQRYRMARCSTARL